MRAAQLMASMAREWRVADRAVGRRDVAPPIHGLLLRRGPSAVLWRVWAVVVDAINRVCGSGLRAHVGVEVLEVQPSVTDRDAASPIVSVGGHARVETTRFHRCPNPILGSEDAPMTARPSACLAPRKAPQRVHRANEISPARADAAVVIRVSGVHMGHADNLNAIDDLPRSVYMSWHKSMVTQTYAQWR
jgi:hypothetical protein